MDPLTTFTLIFIAVILLLVAEIEHRALVAMLAASLSVYFGVSYGLFTYHDVLEMLNLDIVIFITSLLILFEALGRSGLFDFIGLYMAYKIRNRPSLIVLMLVLLTTFFSGISANIMVVLLLGRITLRLAELMKFDGKKVVLLECVQTDIGGLLLPISSIPALIIVSKTGMKFMDYVVISTPLVIFSTIIAILYLKFLKIGGKATGGKLENPWSVVRNPTALYRSLIIFLLFLLAIAFYDKIGLSLSFISFFFATLVFLLSGLNPDDIFSHVDWSLPFFVGGFFVFVGGLEKSGVLEKIAEIIAPVILNTNVYIGAPILLLICALVSAVIDNVPVVLLLYPIVRDIALESGLNPLPFYWALIIGGNLGGRLTTFGSPAVLTGIRLLERKGVEVSLKDYLKVSLPISLSQLILGMIYLMILTILK